MTDSQAKLPRSDSLARIIHEFASGSRRGLDSQWPLFIGEGDRAEYSLYFRGSELRRGFKNQARRRESHE